YFTKSNVAPHLQEYQQMFMYFSKTKDETYTKTIKLTAKKSKRKNLKWISVAASILLLFSVFIGKQEYDKYKIEQQFVQVSKALKMLSTNLQKGDKAFEHLYTYENTVHKIVK
ncbi:MAG: hypothetical protein ACPGTO_07910, partial [Polaribacter sp.]